MMNIVKYFSVIVLIFCAQVVLAQEENALDSESGAILKAIADKYQAYKAVEVEIEYNIQYPEEEPITNTIKLWLKDDMYRIDMDGQMIITDNTTVWNYLTEYQELQISDYNEEEELIKPSKIFDVYSSDYLFRLKEEYTLNGSVYKVVELTPVDKANDLFKIDLTINTTTNEIAATKFYEKNGMRYSYTILSLKVDNALSDDFFSFDEEQFPTEDIVDLR